MTLIKLRLFCTWFYRQLEAILPSQDVKVQGVFRAQSNIYDGAFFFKISPL